LNPEIKTSLNGNKTEEKFPVHRWARLTRTQL
jgi:hypothetical protein